MADELTQYHAALREHAARAEAAHGANPHLRQMRDQLAAHQDAARRAATSGSDRQFREAQNRLAEHARRYSLAVEAHTGPRPAHPHQTQVEARLAAMGAGGGKKVAAPKVVQHGKKGGAYYVGAGGRKVYVGSKRAK